MLLTQYQTRYLYVLNSQGNSLMQNIKIIYYKLAKLVHPDLVTDNFEKERRTLLMSEINQAYAANNIHKLEKILNQLEGRTPNKVSLKNKNTKSKPQIVVEQTVVFKEGFVAKERNLPYLYGNYPKMYGFFIGFSENESSDIYFCECTINPIKNLFRLIKIIEKKDKVYYRNRHLYYYKYFPLTIAEKLKLNNQYQLQYKPLLCHKCNYQHQIKNLKTESIRPHDFKEIAPSLKYCHPMYFTKFTQQYGWYVEQTYLKFGIYPPIGNKATELEYTLEFLPDVCPTEYQNDIIALKEGLKNVREFTRKIENITREEFGVKKLPDK